MFVMKFHLTAAIIALYFNCEKGFSRAQCFGKNLTAVVLSMHNHRFQHTEKVLSRLNFEVIRERPIPYTSPALLDIYNSLKLYDGFPLNLDEYRKTFSNYATFRKAIQSFAVEPPEVSSLEEWRFFFEDDVAVHQGDTSPVCSIRRGMELAQTEGILYLGICGSECFSQNKIEERGVVFSRCYGCCAHAFGLTKWKAGLILDLFLLLQRDIIMVQRLYFDRGLYEYGRRVQPIFVVGANLNRTHPVYGKDGPNQTTSSPVMDHSGIFYQDRKFYSTTIDG